MTGPLDMNNHKITGLDEGTDDFDGANIGQLRMSHISSFLTIDVFEYVMEKASNSRNRLS